MFHVHQSTVFTDIDTEIHIDKGITSISQNDITIATTTVFHETKLFGDSLEWRFRQMTATAMSYRGWTASTRHGNFTQYSMAIMRLYASNLLDRDYFTTTDARIRVPMEVLLLRFWATVTAKSAPKNFTLVRTKVDKIPATEGEKVNIAIPKWSVGL